MVEEIAADIADRSAKDGDIDDGLGTDAIRARMCDEHFADAAIVLVLVGRQTWGRRLTDWEIGSALNRSGGNSPCGVPEAVLPDHQDYGGGRRDPNPLPQCWLLAAAGEVSCVRLDDLPGKDCLSVMWDRSMSRYSTGTTCRLTTTRGGPLTVETRPRLTRRD